MTIAPLRAPLRRVVRPIAEIHLTAPPPVELRTNTLRLLRPHPTRPAVEAVLVALVLLALVAAVARQTAALHPHGRRYGRPVLAAHRILAVASHVAHGTLARVLVLALGAHASVLAHQLRAVLAARAGEARRAVAHGNPRLGDEARAAVVATTFAHVHRGLAALAGPLRRAVAAQRRQRVGGHRDGEVHVAHALVLAVLGAAVVLAAGPGVLDGAVALGRLAWGHLAGAGVAVEGAIGRAS